MASPIIGGRGGNFTQFQSVSQPQSLQDYSPETQEAIAQGERKRQIANLLIQQGTQQEPAGQMVGRFYVPRGWASHAGDLAKILAGMYGSSQVDKGQKEAIAKENEAYTNAIKGYQQRISGTPAVPTQAGAVGTSEDDNAMPKMGTPAIPATPEDKQKAITEALLASRIPAVQRYGMQQQGVLDTSQAREDAQRQQRELLTSQQAQRTHEQQLTLEQRKADQAARLADTKEARQIEDRRARDLQAERLTMQSDMQRERLDAQTEMKKMQLQLTAQNQKLPPTVLKEANDIVDVHRGVGLVNINFKKHLENIKNGTLDLGYAKNLMAQGKNLANMSDPQSQAYNAFIQDVEGARNAILVAAKGVQTEGDATRALNQIMKNLTDPKVVSDSLQKVIDNNSYLQKTQDNKLDFLYSNYNVKAPKTELPEEAKPAPPEPKHERRASDKNRMKFDARGNPIP